MTLARICSISFLIVICFMGCGTKDNFTCDASLLNDPSGYWQGVLELVDSNCSASESGKEGTINHSVLSFCEDTSSGDDAKLSLVDQDGREFHQESYSAFGGTTFVMAGEFESGSRSKKIEIEYDNADGDLADVTISVKVSGGGTPACEEKYAGRARRTN